MNESALQLRSEFLGPLHRETLVSENDLAIVHESLGDFKKAEAAYLDALAKQRTTLGSDDVYTMKTINNLGSLYHKLSDFEQAAKYWEEAYERRKRVLGPEHPEFLSTLGNLPIAYIGLGQLDRAQALFIESLEVSRRVLGEYHPRTINSTTNVGAMYSDRGMYEEALPFALEGWTKSQDVHEPSHMSYLYSGANLAGIYIQLHKGSADPTYLENAGHILARVTAASVESFGEDHPTTLSILGSSADLENQRGNHAAAMAQYRNILSKQLAIFGANNEEVLLTRAGIAYTHLMLDNPEKAIGEYEDLLPVAKDAFGQFHPEYLEIMLGLAEARAANSDLETATLLFRAAVDSYTETLGADDPRTIAAIERQKARLP